jgi:exodeoxyribonuclease I
MSLVFYDTETTGTETFFDQILQFAAVRTDAEFNVLDRFESRCRLLPHVVPAPGAMRVTQLKASQLTDPSYPSHYEMVRAIRAKFVSWSPATFIGYNSLEFDEDLLRQAFYKTLHPPYLTNSNGNSRSDVMRMVQASSLFAPNALAMALDDEGKQIFKLERVAPANGFTHEHAHDAMADVEATIHLCRLLSDRAPDVWSSFMRFSSKAAVVDFITEEQIFCLSDFYSGRPFSCLATVIGQNAKYTPEWFIYDLSVNPESLQSLSDTNLKARLNRSPKPLRRLRSNAVPMLFPADSAPDVCKGKEIAMDELARRANLLRSDGALCAQLISAFESLKKEYPASPHIEKQIYDGFFEDADEQRMAAFHQTPWPNRFGIIETFDDPRLKTIARQLIYIERPDLLHADIHQEHQVAAAKRLLGHGEDVAWLTLPEALEEIESMLTASSGAELELLRQHQQYLRQRLDDARKHTN